MPIPVDFSEGFSRQGKPPRHWMDLTPDERIQAVTDLGLPAFRARQISTQVFARLNADPETWSDLPAQVRPQLAEAWMTPPLAKIAEYEADGGDTIKTAWRGFDGAIVESVIMVYPNRVTLCISSQAGCGMNCPFCATGQGGLQRNLSAGEIVWQAWDATRRIRERGIGEHLSNIVFMGMGEPLANYSSLMKAIRTLHAPAPDGLGISARGITVSTVGMVPRINQMAEEGLPLTLALSLHAPDDELRNDLVPLNQHFNVDAVLDAAWNYAKVTKRRVSIEYILIREMNDQVWRADMLARRLQARGDWGWFHVNAIPLNPTPGSKWTRSKLVDEKAFLARLEQAGVPVTLRETRGQEIDGACGQLATTLRTPGAQPTTP